MKRSVAYPPTLLNSLFGEYDSKQSNLIIRTVVRFTTHPKDIKGFLAGVKRRGLVTKARKAYLNFSIHDEIRRALLALKGQRDPLWQMVKKYQRYWRAEARAARLNSRDRALFIGCGPYPYSAFFYAMDFGCKVVCLERSTKCCAIARRLIEKKGLSRAISVVCGNSVTFNYGRFHKIFFATQVEDKERSLRQIEKTAPDGALVVTRTSDRKGLNSILSKPLELKRVRGFEYVRTLTWSRYFTLPTFTIILRKLST